MASSSLASCNTSFRRNNNHALQESRNRCARPYQRQKLKRYVSALSNKSSSSNFDSSDSIVTINVSGSRYETHLSNLDRFPDSLLGSPERRLQYYDVIRDEFFFDRNRRIFGSILEFYQTNGILRKPDNIPLDAFLEELTFFGIPKEAIKHFLAEDLVDEEDDGAVEPKGCVRRQIWMTLERPNSSKFAQVLASFNILVILLAVVNYSVETLPEFRHYQNYTVTNNKESNFSPFNNPFFVLETTCNIWFCLELGMRFIVNPEKVAFFLKIINVIDFVCILPYFVDLVLYYTTQRKANVLLILQILRLFRLLRIFRIFKLSRYSDGLKILWLTMRSARDELGVLCLLFGIGLTICSAAIYIVETGYEDTDFKDIPGSFWWTVITWTTVGYGDMVPKQPLGKLVGGVCSAVGVVCLAFIVPIIVAHFEYFFRRHMSPSKDGF